MAFAYDPKRDVMTGHDFPGVVGHGMHDYAMDEIEVGARVAQALSDPDQAWWETIGYARLAADTTGAES